MTDFENFLFAQQSVKVIEASAFAAIDLSVSNTLLNEISSADAQAFEAYIEQYLAKKDAQAAFGGYNEVRNLYRRSVIFNDSETEERNIHIGLDIWIAAETPVFAALDGKIQSFDYNTGTGNYGPTVILEHDCDGQTFYTLYGHLSLESIEELEIGDPFRKGQQLATLGAAVVNGDYAPHLHFQVIKNIGDYFGDYPGVCSSKDLPYYLENCPDPNLLLKLNQ